MCVWVSFVLLLYSNWRKNDIIFGHKNSTVFSTLRNVHSTALIIWTIIQKCEFVPPIPITNYYFEQKGNCGICRQWKNPFGYFSVIVAHGVFTPFYLPRSLHLSEKVEAILVPLVAYVLSDFSVARELKCSSLCISNRSTVNIFMFLLTHTYAASTHISPSFALHMYYAIFGVKRKR